MSESKETGRTTINGVDIVEDGDVTHFSISDDAKMADEQRRNQEMEKAAKDNESFLDKVCRWFKSGIISPCVNVRDLADPFGDRHRDPDDFDAGNDGAVGIEAGFKVRF